MSSRLLEIKQLGQQIWLDNLARELISSGTLKQLIKEDGISGITSNPTIFYKAISSDKNYQQDLAQLKSSNLSAEERYEALVIPDIQAACDLMLPEYNMSNYERGYVSFELSPELANDANGSIENAKRLWHEIDKPNLMIKVPGTAEGTAALEELIAEGINVNITLLFSIEQVQAIWDAYIRGLNRRLQQQKPLNHIKAVASFFLSRVDSAIDSKLPQNLQGTTAINLAKTVYGIYQERFEGTEFAQLKAAGAKPQDLLWASTGTKNSNYRDVMYVETLIGPNTINTLPDATLTAFRDHGVAKITLTQDVANATSCLNTVNQYTNLTELGTQLQQDGLKLFANSFTDLMSLMQ